MIVVDASVAVKWTVAEPGREMALRVLAHADELIAPDLLVAESANVLRKKSKLGEISVRQSEEALRVIQVAIPRFVPSVELAEDALAQNLDHSVYDCFYLACALPASILVTADDRFATKCQTHGFALFVRSPEEIDTDTKVQPIGIEQTKIEIIERLSTQMERTFESLREGARSSPEPGQFNFVSSKVYRPAFDSPAYRRLVAELDKLSGEELATLVALGWLGRSYHGPEEWTSLVTNATQMVSVGRDEHMRYFVAQMSNVTRGLAKLQAFHPLRSPR